MAIERVQADDQATFLALRDFLLPMAAEVAIFPVDMPFAHKNLWLGITEGNTFICRENGRIVGAICMVQVGPPFACWYAPESYLIDQYFYVSAGERGGRIGKLLLRAVKYLAEPLGMPAFVRVMNPNREGGRGIKVMGFLPVGHMSRLR